MFPPRGACVLQAQPPDPSSAGVTTTEAESEGADDSPRELVAMILYWYVTPSVTSESDNERVEPSTTATRV